MYIYIYIFNTYIHIYICIYIYIYVCILYHILLYNLIICEYDVIIGTATWSPPVDVTHVLVYRTYLAESAAGAGRLQHHTMLCCVILHYIILHYIILYCIILQYDMILYLMILYDIKVADREPALRGHEPHRGA